MKIELDLTTLNTETSIQAATAGVVAIMRMLPEDEVQLAIAQWVAGRKVEQEADRQEPAPRTLKEMYDQLPTEYPDIYKPPVQHVAVTSTNAAVQVQHPQPEPEPQPKPEPKPYPTPPEPSPPEPKPDGSQAAAKPSYEKFTYGDRSFSVHKRGPSAALRQAFADILAETDPAKLLGPLSLKLANLVGILEEIGRKDLADQIPPALEKRKAELAGVTVKAGDKGTSEGLGPVVAIPAPTGGGEEHLKVDLTQPEEPAAEQGSIAAPTTQLYSVPAGKKEEGSLGLVSYAGKNLRPVVARSLCLKHIAACTTIEEVDQLSNEADRLTDRLDEMGEGAFASEIRTRLSAKTDALAEAEAAAADASGQPVAAPEPAQSQPTPAQPTNGAGGNGSKEPETLRHLLRRAEHQLGRVWVGKLLKAHGATTIKELDKANEPAVRAAALEGLAQAG